MTSQQCKEAFDLFDRDGDGKIALDELGNLLRALGRTPTEAQVRGWTSEISSTSSSSSNANANTFTYPILLTLLDRIPGPPDAATMEAQLRDAFKVFDKEGKGQIATAELRHIVTSLGEKLTDPEADEMMREADPEGSGLVDYERFIKKLVSN